jgi:DNA-directed RNA polymerase specialized sigma24 family protein
MYDKDKISKLFCQYCDTEDDKIFEKLIMACKPMIKMLLSKYPNFSSDGEDIIQEVQIKMWNTLRKPERLRMSRVHPVTFLFYRLWPYLYDTLSKYSRMNGVPLSLTPAEREVIQSREIEKLSWKEIAQFRTADEWTVRCMYYIGKQKQRRSMIMLEDTYYDKVSTYQGDLIDPSRQFEAKEIKRHWGVDALRTLLLHPVYAKFPDLRREVYEKFKRLMRDDIGDSDEFDQSTDFSESHRGNGGGVSQLGSGGLIDALPTGRGHEVACDTRG